MTTIQSLSDDVDDGKEGNRFREGQKIEARFGGRDKWFKGKITRARSDGTYDVLYEDGDTERRVKARLIRATDRRKKRASSVNTTDDESSAAFREGQHIEARFGGRDKWFKGKITRARSDGTYDVLYEDGDTERRVKARLVRSVDRMKRVSPKRSAPTDSDSERENDVFQKVDDGDFVQKGTVVKARFGGGRDFKRGVVRRVRGDGTYDVDYDNGESDKHVKLKHIRVSSKKTSRPRDSSSASSGHSSGSDVESAAKKRFEVNAKVQARARGSRRWHRARVRAIHRDGTYDVQFEESGKQEKRVKPSHVKKRDSSAYENAASSASTSDGSDKDSDDEVNVTFRKGARVHARPSGHRHFVDAKIVHVHRDGSYDVRFTNGRMKGKKETRVKSNHIKKKSTETSGSSSDAASDEDGASGTATDASSPPFERGDIVRARRRGSKRWHNAKIRKIHSDGTVDVTYVSSGKIETRVKSSHVQHAKAEDVESSDEEGASDSDAPVDSTSFERGDKVLARANGSRHWKEAKILKRHSDGTYDVKFASSGKTVKRVKASHVKQRKTDDDDDDASVTSDVDASSDDRTTLSKGDRVRARFEGGRLWQHGRIRKVHQNGTYDVEYDDGERETRVKRSFMKHLASDEDEGEDDKNVEIHSGDLVRVRSRKSKWSRAIVTRRYRDDTFDVELEDGGKTRERVKRKHIRLIQRKTKHSPKDRQKRSVWERLWGGKKESRHDGEEEEEDSELNLDDGVSFRLKGQTKWTKGVLVRKRKGGAQWDVSCDADGAIKKHVDSSRIRKRTRREKVVDDDDDDDDDDDAVNEDEEFEEGDAVEVRSSSSSSDWKRGEVSRVRENGTYDVEMDAGHPRKRVKRRNMRRWRNRNQKEVDAAGHLLPGHMWRSQLLCRVALCVRSGVKRVVRKGTTVQLRKTQKAGASAWTLAKVIEVHSDGSCDVRLRKTREKIKRLEPSRFAPLPESYRVGSIVHVCTAKQVASKKKTRTSPPSFDRLGKITNVNADSTMDVTLLDDDAGDDGGAPVAGDEGTTTRVPFWRVRPRLDTECAVVLLNAYVSSTDAHRRGRVLSVRSDGAYETETESFDSATTRWTVRGGKRSSFFSGIRGGNKSSSSGRNKEKATHSIDDIALENSFFAIDLAAEKVSDNVVDLTVSDLVHRLSSLGLEDVDRADLVKLAKSYAKTAVGTAAEKKKKSRGIFGVRGGQGGVSDGEEDALVDLESFLDELDEASFKDGASFGDPSNFPALHEIDTARPKFYSSKGRRRRRSTIALGSKKELNDDDVVSANGAGMAYDLSSSRQRASSFVSVKISLRKQLKEAVEAYERDVRVEEDDDGSDDAQNPVLHLFRAYDADNSGSIDRDEFEEGVRALLKRGSGSDVKGEKEGESGKSKKRKGEPRRGDLTKSDLRSLLGCFDLQGDGQIDYSEFVAFAKRGLEDEDICVLADQIRDHLLLRFAADEEEDGGASSSSKKKKRTASITLRKAFEAFDSDGDGFVDEDEFVETLRKNPKLFGLDKDTLKSDDVRRLFKYLDARGRKRVAYDDFLRFVSPNARVDELESKKLLGICLGVDGGLAKVKKMMRECASGKRKTIVAKDAFRDVLLRLPRGKELLTSADFGGLAIRYGSGKALNRIDYSAMLTSLEAKQQKRRSGKRRKLRVETGAAASKEETAEEADSSSSRRRPRPRSSTTIWIPGRVVRRKQKGKGGETGETFIYDVRCEDDGDVLIDVEGRRLRPLLPPRVRKEMLEAGVD
eukprot:g4810.t1